ncbi:hypothetical protein [uncultured Maribacter sp.]|uniref:hypothetical protein n=1 Tax=uncultured Maribacter sp. TaxID=431308 RepID=UPI0030EE15DB|tara:strand:+ start:7200 stop:7640 length:441 start_codon:yes stop_codon:yes gene_type:complete
MKNLSVCYLFICLCLTSCLSQKKLQTGTSFEIGKATSQSWVGGREESSSGVELNIPITFTDKMAVEVQEVYFRGKQVVPTVNSIEGQNVVVARIPNSQPESSETIDLGLQSNEAVLKYLENNEIKYTKITDIKQKQPLIYKSASKN